jgi:primosomal protein N' (replication factor Y)
MMSVENKYAEVILPVPIPTLFSYGIPAALTAKVKEGVRVLVPLGAQSLYKGIVRRLSKEGPAAGKVKDILEVLDEYPVAGEVQFRFWDWLAEYYMCTLGEVYRAALPSGLQKEYAPRFETCTMIAEAYRDDEKLNEVMDGMARAPKQLKILQQMVALAMDKGSVASGLTKSELSAGYEFSQSAYQALLKKNILVEYREETSRLEYSGRTTGTFKQLSDLQQKALEQIIKGLKKQPVILLKGVTSSGKTEIYIQLIRAQIKLNRQVLYLLPEIALTAQIVERLKAVFGDQVGIYHSRYSDAERVETFLRVRENGAGKEFKVVLGARSAIFLPFRDLGLIIIDEEYEQSYKQADPAPRYHARDAAVILADMYKAKVILGSATPSFESYHNARSNKFGMVTLNERFNQVTQPEIIIADIREAYRKKQMRSHFTPQLFSLMEETLAEDRQLILFQNRRGFSPYIECFACGWIPSCIHCDVSLTYHKQDNKLVCHYCGYAAGVPHKCSECRDTQLVTRGFGTEKIEEEVSILFPGYRIARMDFDTTRTRRRYERIIRDFEGGLSRILIGTQIVTKGLDFDNVGLVGVLHADNLLNFPDFRSFERSYQLMAQVAGRAGRKDGRGKVVIQTTNPEHPVIHHINGGDYHSMYMSQMEDRQAFHYPPYSRLLRINLRHESREIVDSASNELAGNLRKVLNVPVMGPQAPLVGRIQQMQLMNILVKLPMSTRIGDHKSVIKREIDAIRSRREYRKLFIVPDVDPV